MHCTKRTPERIRPGYPEGTAPGVPFLIGRAQGLRYLSIIRSDERIRSRAPTWLAVPAAILLAWTVLRRPRWHGVATCARTGWGTRQNGAEVSLTEPHNTISA